MKRYDVKFVAFCTLFNNEMQSILKDENITLEQAKERTPEFVPWYELIEMVEEASKVKVDAKTFDSVYQDLKRVSRDMDNILWVEQVEYYPCVLYFNMLQSCKFSCLRSDNGGPIDKLKAFDFTSLYPLIDKYNLRNNFKFMKASLVFKKRYWENYE